MILDRFCRIKTAQIFYELKKMNPEVKAIIVGSSMDYQARQLPNYGAYTFIQKPYRTDNLLIAIRNHLGVSLNGLGVQRTDSFVGHNGLDFLGAQE